MKEIPPKILVLGIGNLLMGDEGVGVHFARAMAGEELPANVDVLEGGTGGFHLMEYFESYPLVLMVDATLDGRPAGEIRLVEPRFSSEFPKALSTHDIGLKDLLEGLQILGRMPRIFQFTVSIDELQPMQLTLSEPVANALPELIRRSKELLIRLQQDSSFTSTTSSNGTGIPSAD